jgi:hypothetical protein
MLLLLVGAVGGVTRADHFAGQRVGARTHIYSAKATLLVVEPGSRGL